METIFKHDVIGIENQNIDMLHEVISDQLELLGGKRQQSYGGMSSRRKLFQQTHSICNIRNKMSLELRVVNVQKLKGKYDRFVRVTFRGRRHLSVIEFCCTPDISVQTRPHFVHVLCLKVVQRSIELLFIKELFPIFIYLFGRTIQLRSLRKPPVSSNNNIHREFSFEICSTFL